MHSSIVIALALTAAVCAKSASIEPLYGEVTTEEDFAAEHTTLDSVTDLKITNDSDATKDTVRDSVVLRKRRIGGRFTDVVEKDEFDEDFPFVVAFYDDKDDYVCMGTILTSRLILTAAHCVEDEELVEPVSYVRAHTRDKHEGGEIHHVEKHILYGEGHDIALLQLKTPISNARPVVLLSPEVSLNAGQEAMVLGWGRTKNDYWPRYLRYNDLVISSHEECWDMYGSHNWICTETSSSYSCNGDSGGPLLYFGLQVGITSGSKAEKCNSGIPTANVDVRKYWDWIQSHVDIKGAFEKSAFGVLWRKYHKKRTV